ncbi:MAG: hypothetical protein GTO12_00445 [Proteobacteria bacterium]|nr:hypothetical protein [Pseudomonadota bacterium]
MPKESQRKDHRHFGKNPLGVSRVKTLNRYTAFFYLRKFFALGFSPDPMAESRLNSALGADSLGRIRTP